MNLKYLIIGALFAIIPFTLAQGPPVSAKMCANRGGRVVKMGGRMLCQGGAYNGSPVR
jgi:hypothetical protein